MFLGACSTCTGLSMEKETRHGRVYDEHPSGRDASYKHLEKHDSYMYLLRFSLFVE